MVYIPTQGGITVVYIPYPGRLEGRYTLPREARREVYPPRHVGKAPWWVYHPEVCREAPWWVYHT